MNMSMIYLNNGVIVQAEVNGKTMDGKFGSVWFFNEGKVPPGQFRQVLIDGALHAIRRYRVGENPEDHRILIEENVDDRLRRAQEEDNANE